MANYVLDKSGSQVNTILNTALTSVTAIVTTGTKIAKIDDVELYAPAVSVPVTSVNGQTGDITITDSDANVRQESVTTVDDYTILFAPDNVQVARTQGVKKHEELLFHYGGSNFNSSDLLVGDLNGKYGSLSQSTIHLSCANSGYYGQIKTVNSLSANKTYTLPDKTGTVALTSDIPSVPSWALNSTKPSYTASEVGALPDSTVIPDLSDYIPAYNFGVILSSNTYSIYDHTYADVYNIADEGNQVILNYNDYLYYTTYFTDSSIIFTCPQTGNYFTLTDNSLTYSNTSFLTQDTNTTYILSMSGNRITLTPSSGTATYVDLPVYDGSTSPIPA